MYTNYTQVSSLMTSHCIYVMLKLSARADPARTAIAEPVDNHRKAPVITPSR